MLNVGLNTVSTNPNQLSIEKLAICHEPCEVEAWIVQGQASQILMNCSCNLNKMIYSHIVHNLGNQAVAPRCSSRLVLFSCCCLVSRLNLPRNLHPRPLCGEAIPPILSSLDLVPSSRHHHHTLDRRTFHVCTLFMKPSLINHDLLTLSFDKLKMLQGATDWLEPVDVLGWRPWSPPALGNRNP